MKYRTLYSVLAIFILVGVISLACQPEPAPTGVETQPPAGTEMPTEAMTTEMPTETLAVTEAPSRAPTEAIAAGGTLNFAQSADGRTLDPALETDANNLAPASHVYEGLTNFAPGSATLVPALATTWDVSEDGLDWTFHLRDGVVFHDGTPFNADAVVFNFERWWDLENPYNLGADQFIYWDYMFQGFKDQKTDLGQPKGILAGVEKVDVMTVKLKLNRPNASLLSTLAMENFRFASPTAIREQGENYSKADGHAVGTGPFILKEWVQEDHITLARFDDYWGEAPTLDEIVYRVIPDPNAAFTALQEGEIDMISLWANLSPGHIAQAQADPNIQVVYNPTFNVGYLGLNQAKEWLQNRNVRLAIAHAIDKQAIIDALYLGGAEPAKEFQPPSLWGFNEEIRDYPYDPTKAREHLDQALAEGVEIPNPAIFYVLPVSRLYYPEPLKVGELIQAALAELGINTEIRTPSWPNSYLGELKEDGAKHDIFLLGRVSENGDPDNFLCALFCGRDTSLNHTEQGVGAPPDEETAQLLRDAVVEIDFDTRQAMYEQANQMIYDRILSIPIVKRTPPTLLRANIEGYVPSPMREVLTYLIKK